MAMKPPTWAYTARWLGLPGFVLILVALTAVDYFPKRTQLWLFLCLTFLGLLLLAAGTAAIVLTFFRSADWPQDVPGSTQALNSPSDSTGEVPLSIRRILLLACGALLFVVVGAILVWSTITPGRYHGDLVQLIAGIVSIGFFGAGFAIFLLNLALGRVRGLVLNTEGLSFPGRFGVGRKTIEWRSVRAFKIVYRFGNAFVGYDLVQSGSGRSQFNRELHGSDGFLPNYLAASNAELLVTLDAWRRRFSPG
jgi:hypothetical protein